MTNIKKIKAFFVSLVAAAALLATTSSAAMACGSYGPPTEEQLVTRAVWSAFYAEAADPPASAAHARLDIDAVRVVGGRLAFVTGQVVDGEDVSDTTYALIKLGGTWTVAQRAVAMR